VNHPGGAILLAWLVARWSHPRVLLPRREGKFRNFHHSGYGRTRVRLSLTDGLDDGPDYSPDGRWIYFNSDRTGRMQIWRMRPDGAASEPVTDDGFNNWFAHPSPDGQWVVFLSYEETCPASARSSRKSAFASAPAARLPCLPAFLVGKARSMSVVVAR